MRENLCFCFLSYKNDDTRFWKQTGRGISKDEERKKKKYKNCNDIEGRRIKFFEKSSIDIFFFLFNFLFKFMERDFSLSLKSRCFENVDRKDREWKGASINLNLSTRYITAAYKFVILQRRVRLRPIIYSCGAIFEDRTGSKWRSLNNFQPI